MNILFISTLFLFRETRFGGSKRLYAIAKELSKKHDVHVLCLDGCNEIGNKNNYPVEFEHFLYVPEDRPRRLHERHLPINHIPYLIGRHESGISLFVNAAAFDAVFLAFPYALSFLDILPEAARGKVTYLEDDLYLEKLRMEAEVLSNPVRRFWKRFRYRQLLDYYGKRLHHIKHFIGISREEIEIFRRYFPWVDAKVITYGVDPLEFQFLPPPQDRSTVGFLGNYRHTPNRDGMEWFLRRCLQPLANKNPAIKFCWAGPNIPESLRKEFGAVPSLIWRDDVADVRDFYSSISVFVNPIVSGRGLRTKLIEAAALGRPIVSTRLGAEGLDDLKIERADDPDTIAAACTELVNNADYYHETARHNKKIVSEKYTAAEIARQVEEVLFS
ncbi:MAG TPA: glycosyltransferase family 4 protein [Chitinivibrionales bacterium]|nr:glycosyltransferase family 4 protein [Chitinivibrionales bacterium]